MRKPCTHISMAPRRGPVGRETAAGLAEERVLFLGSKQLLLRGAKYLLEEDKKRQIPPKTDPAVADCGCSPGKTLWCFLLGQEGVGGCLCLSRCLSFALEREICDLRCRNNRRQQQKEGEESPSGMLTWGRNTAWHSAPIPSLK